MQKLIACFFNKEGCCQLRYIKSKRSRDLFVTNEPGNAQLLNYESSLNLYSRLRKQKRSLSFPVFWLYQNGGKDMYFLSWRIRYYRGYFGKWCASFCIYGKILRICRCDFMLLIQQL